MSKKEYSFRSDFFDVTDIDDADIFYNCRVMRAFNAVKVVISMRDEVYKYAGDFYSRLAEQPIPDEACAKSINEVISTFTIGLPARSANIDACRINDYAKCNKWTTDESVNNWVKRFYTQYKRLIKPDSPDVTKYFELIGKEIMSDDLKTRDVQVEAESSCSASTCDIQECDCENSETEFNENSYRHLSTIFRDFEFGDILDSRRAVCASINALLVIRASDDTKKTMSEIIAELATIAHAGVKVFRRFDIPFPTKTV